MKAAGTTIILSTHNMESVEELCDSIALINRSNLIVSGNTDKIRREYGNNQVELVYRSADSITEYFKSLQSSIPGAMPFEIVSDEQSRNGRRAVLEVPRDVTNARVLGSVIKHVDVVSYQELIPRMKDIFIKLVSSN